MDHDTMRAQLSALYDGELAGEPRRALEEHLLDCAECRAWLTRWKLAAASGFSSPDALPSETFVERVMQRVAAPRPRPFRLSRWVLEGGWLVPAMGVAAALIVIGGPLQQSVSIESLLLSDGDAPSALQRILSEESHGTDEVLGLLMEEER